MILYVLLVWLCAIGIGLLVELALISVQISSNWPLGIATQAGTTVPIESNSAIFLLWGTSAFVLGLAVAYIIEALAAPVHRLYSHLQRTYPGWYQAWPADKREVLIALLMGSMLCLLCWAPLLWLGARFPYWGSVPLGLGISTGLLIRPVLRYRYLLVEDRPDTGPKALLHQVAPTYSQERALKIGQIYLRFLLPLFSLFCMVLLPLVLSHIPFGALQGALMMLGLVSGIGLGWWINRDTHLDIQHFQQNLYQLSALALVSSGLLIFGFLSGNPIQLLFMSAFGGYIAALY